MSNRVPFAERLRAYADARDAGQSSYNAAIAADVDPGAHGARYERWYQVRRGAEPPPPGVPRPPHYRRHDVVQKGFLW